MNIFKKWWYQIYAGDRTYRWKKLIDKDDTTLLYIPHHILQRDRYHILIGHQDLLMDPKLSSTETRILVWAHRGVDICVDDFTEEDFAHSGVYSNDLMRTNLSKALSVVSADTWSGYFKYDRTYLPKHPGIVTVSGCGGHHRTIFINLNNPEIIHIGCFSGGRIEAIDRVNEEYASRPFKRREYTCKINECFRLAADKTI